MAQFREWTVRQSTQICKLINSWSILGHHADLLGRYANCAFPPTIVRELTQFRRLINSWSIPKHHTDLFGLCAN